MTRLILSLVALDPFVASAFAAAPAEARSVECDFSGHCAVRCTQKLADGAVIEYEEGSTITITTTSGTVTKFKCVNDNWVHPASALTIALPQFLHIQLLGEGNLYGSLAGLKRDVTQTTCNNSPGPACTLSSYTIGTPLFGRGGGCNPQQVTSFQAVTP